MMTESVDQPLMVKLLAQSQSVMTGRSEPTWLVEWRQQMVQQLRVQKPPSRQDEAWRYANLAFMQDVEYRVCQPPSAQAKAKWHQAWLKSDFSRQSGVRIVLLDGHYCAELSTLTDLPEGVSILPLDAACAKQAAMQKHASFGLRSPAVQDTFLLMNAVCWRSGMWLSLAPDVRLSHPIQLVYGVTQPDGLAATRHIIELGANSHVRIEEIVYGLDGVGGMQLPVSHVDLAPGAHCHWIKCQQESAHTTHIANQFVEQAQDSQWNVMRMSLGAAFSREACWVNVKGTEASCCLDGLHLGTDQQFVDTHLQVNHCAEHGVSRQNYRSIVAKQASSVFNGKVVVHQDAQNIDADQTSHNVILDQGACAYSKPELEIYADDVKCTHGTTVGQLDEDARFYLRARGIPKVQAERLLLDAFVESILDNISDSPLCEGIRKWVKQRLSAMC